MAESEALQRWKVTEPYLNIHCALAEAPYYEAATHRLRFVDIKKHRLHVIDLAAAAAATAAGDDPSSLVQTLQLDMPIGVTADIAGVDPAKKILVGGKTGLAVLDRASGRYRVLRKFYDDDDEEHRDDVMRSNDGAVDSEGRMWIGTMNDFHVGEPKAVGTLFRIDPDLSLHAMKTHLTIPNGIGWPPPNTTLLFTHSTERVLYSYDFSASTGAITHERVFYRHDGPGEPDGWAMDVSGHIWLCVYGEGQVLRIDPRGKLVGVVELPTRNVSCPCFVSTELWVASAAEADPVGFPESARWGGGVFKVDVGVEGRKKNAFRLDEGIDI